MVICLECDADLHMAKLMPLPLTVSCSSKIQIGLTCLASAHLGSPGQRAIKRVCVCSLTKMLLFRFWQLSFWLRKIKLLFTLLKLTITVIYCVHV